MAHGCNRPTCPKRDGCQYHIPDSNMTPAARTNRAIRCTIINLEQELEILKILVGEREEDDRIKA